MSLSGIPCAYLVTSMVRTELGVLTVEGETVCHDRDLAFEMAEADCCHCDWVGVYALDANGRCITGAPIYFSGLLIAPTDAYAVPLQAQATSAWRPYPPFS